MKVVYVAGKFRGPNNWAIQQNVRRAEEMSLRVAELGAMPLCPHKNTQHFQGLLNDQFWLDGTLELLRRCDAVVLCEGWEDSLGTRGEVMEAKRLGIPVFEGTAALNEWLGR